MFLIARLEFGSLYLSVCSWPTVGDELARRLSAALHLAIGATVSKENLKKSFWGPTKFWLTCYVPPVPPGLSKLGVGKFLELREALLTAADTGR
jgi:hypothetical protein